MRAQKSKMGTMDQKWNLISYSEPEIYARLKNKKKTLLGNWSLAVCVFPGLIIPIE